MIVMMGMEIGMVWGVTTGVMVGVVMAVVIGTVLGTVRGVAMRIMGMMGRMGIMYGGLILKIKVSLGKILIINKKLKKL